MSETAVTEEKNEQQIDPLESAAMQFTNLLPYVKKFSATTSTKGLARVLHAVAEFPLGNDKPRLLNENERMLFSIMQEIQQHKSVLLQSYMQEMLAKERALEGESKSGEEK
jgi:hypothetical protein